MSRDPLNPPATPLASLGSTLSLPRDKYGKRLRPVVEAIDRLHRLRRTKTIPVIVTTTREWTGCYRKHPGTGEPISIEVSKKNDSMELTIAHEVGHFLEGALIPGSAFGVRNWNADDVMRGWRIAIQSTESYGLLKTITETGQVLRGDPGGNLSFHESLPPYVSYLMTDQELWARSYAQWVAERSRDGALIEQVRRFCSPPSGYPLQWKPGDFEPVANEVDALFDGIGWRI